TGAIQSVVQQCRKSGLQGVMLYTVCHAVDSFVGMGNNAPKKSPAGFACRCFAARLCRPPRFGQLSRATPVEPLAKLRSGKRCGAPVVSLKPFFGGET
ncbi:MAG: hypothetical protein ACRCTX_21120, partial [Afipia sp.]